MERLATSCFFFFGFLEGGSAVATTCGGLRKVSPLPRKRGKEGGVREVAGGFQIFLFLFFRTKSAKSSKAPARLTAALKTHQESERSLRVRGGGVGGGGGRGEEGGQRGERVKEEKQKRREAAAALTGLLSKILFRESSGTLNLSILRAPCGSSSDASTCRPGALWETEPQVAAATSSSSSSPFPD